jgi:glutathione S-transferase
VVPRPQADPEWNAADLRPLLETLTFTLSQSAYLAGADSSIADFAVAGMMTYFRYARFPFEHHSEISNWYQRIEVLKGWQESQDPLWFT